MISNITKGQSFRGLLRYCHTKEGAKQIGGNMVGDTPSELNREFQISRALNPFIQKPAYHISLSVPSEEHSLSPRTWRAIAKDYMGEMFARDHQYVVYNHSDRDHDHIHVVTSRIGLVSGELANDAWDYFRTQTAVRQLESKYDLIQLPCSWQTDWQRDIPRQRIRTALHDILSGDRPLLIDQLSNQLKPKDIDVVLTSNGISFKSGDDAFSGRQLSPEYALPRLVESGRLILPNHPESTIDLTQRQHAQAIAALAYDIFDQLHQAGVTTESESGYHYSGQHYGLELENGRFTITAPGRGELLQIKDDELREAQALEFNDVLFFQQLHKELFEEKLQLD